MKKKNVTTHKSLEDYLVKPGEQSPYANLLIDLAFKKAFDPDKPVSRENLINLLNDLLALQLKRPIRNVKTRNVAKNLSGSKVSRTAIFDLHCEDDAGNLIEIEVQIREMDNFLKRLAFYASELVANQAEPGDWNYDVKPTYVIALAQYCIFENDDRIVHRATTLDLETGEQIMEAPDAPLTNVVQLCAGENWHFARCADGTVRAWGMNGEFGNPESTAYMKSFGTMGVGWMDAKVVEHPKESTVGTQPLREKSADDLTYISVTTAPLVTICETPYAIPVMENETTPLSNVADVRCSGSQALFEKTDGSMHWSGAVQNLSLGDYPQLKMAVYAIPMQFFGAQVYLRLSSESSPYSTERAQAIRLDKPAAAAVVGDTFRLTATLTPADTYERNIRWKSSDTTIATVDSSGVVTAKAAGVAVIRAYITSNSKVWGQCLLSVEEEAPKSATLRQAPTKRSYTTDDTALDTSGGSLLLTYPNGQQRGVSISPDYCTGYDFTRTGEQTVTITFGGETFTYTITVADAAITPPPVQDKTVTGIRWEKYPDGCVGLLGGRFVVPDASIRILYADGSYALVPLTAEMCSGMDMEKAGTQSVTVTCEGFTLLFSLTLLPRIRWEGYPAVGVGVVGGSFVVPDASVCVQNEDGSTVILPLTAEMCSGYDMQKPGIQTVTVTVDGYTLSYSLKLLPRLSWISEPAKITIAYGDPLTVPGASFLVYQDDGSSEVVPLTPELCVGYDPYTYGIQTVEVPYVGDVLTFPVTVGLEGVTSVAVETPCSATPGRTSPAARCASRLRTVTSRLFP